MATTDLDRFKRRLIRSVAGQIKDNVPLEDIWPAMTKSTGSDCQTLWKRMRALTIKKLSRLLPADDKPKNIAPVARMSLTDWLMFDLVLVHEDIDLIGSESKLKDNRKEPKAIVDLFMLIQTFNLEDQKRETLSEAWVAATLHYNQDGRQCSPMLLQRRWHQMKSAARYHFYNFWANYTRIKSNNKLADSIVLPSPLHVAIARRYPKVITEKLPSWESFMKNGLIVLPNEFQTKFQQENLPQPNSDNPDIILIEPQVETINLEQDTDSDNEVDENSVIEEKNVLTNNDNPKNIYSDEAETAAVLNCGDAENSPSPVTNVHNIDNEVNNETADGLSNVKIIEAVHIFDKNQDMVEKEAILIPNKGDTNLNEKINIISDDDMEHDGENNTNSVDDNQVVNKTQQEDINDATAIVSSGITQENTQLEIVHEKQITSNVDVVLVRTDTAIIGQTIAIDNENLQKNDKDEISNDMIHDTKSKCNIDQIANEKGVEINSNINKGKADEDTKNLSESNINKDEIEKEHSNKISEDASLNKLNKEVLLISPEENKAMDKQDIEENKEKCVNKEILINSPPNKTDELSDDDVVILPSEAIKTIQIIDDKVEESKNEDHDANKLVSESSENGNSAELEILDDGIAFDEDDLIDSNVDDKFHSEHKVKIESEGNKSLQINNEERDASDTKFDLKLIMQAVVYTKDLNEMVILKDKDLHNVDTKDIINDIITESKPRHNKGFLLNKPNAFEEESANTSYSSVDGKTGDDIIKLSSNFEIKAKPRIYTPILLCKNPDFNTRLRRLSVSFFSHPRNRLYLKACKPLTIDLFKVCDMNVCDGTITCNNSGSVETTKSSNSGKKTPDIAVNSIIPTNVPANSLFNDIDVNDAFKTTETSKQDICMQDSSTVNIANQVEIDVKPIVPIIPPLQIINNTDNEKAVLKVAEDQQDTSIVLQENKLEFTATDNQPGDEKVSILAERKNKPINLHDIVKVRRINQHLLTAEVSPLQNNIDKIKNEEKKLASSDINLVKFTKTGDVLYGVKQKKPLFKRPTQPWFAKKQLCNEEHLLTHDSLLKMIKYLMPNWDAPKELQPVKKKTKRKYCCWFQEVKVKKILFEQGHTRVKIRNHQCESYEACSCCCKMEQISHKSTTKTIEGVDYKQNITQMNCEIQDAIETIQPTTNIPDMIKPTMTAAAEIVNRKLIPKPAKTEITISDIIYNKMSLKRKNKNISTFNQEVQTLIELPVKATSIKKGQVKRITEQYLTNADDLIKEMSNEPQVNEIKSTDISNLVNVDQDITTDKNPCIILSDEETVDDSLINVKRSRQPAPTSVRRQRNRNISTKKIMPISNQLVIGSSNGQINIDASLNQGDKSLRDLFKEFNVITDQTRDTGKIDLGKNKILLTTSDLSKYTQKKNLIKDLDLPAGAVVTVLPSGEVKCVVDPDSFNQPVTATQLLLLQNIVSSIQEYVNSLPPFEFYNPHEEETENAVVSSLQKLPGNVYINIPLNEQVKAVFKTGLDNLSFSQLQTVYNITAAIEHYIHNLLSNTIMENTEVPKITSVEHSVDNFQTDPNPDTIILSFEDNANENKLDPIIRSDSFREENNKNVDLHPGESSNNEIVGTTLERRDVNIENINNASENEKQLTKTDNDPNQDSKKSESSESSNDEIIRTTLERRDNNIQNINKASKNDKQLTDTDSGSNQDSKSSELSESSNNEIIGTTLERRGNNIENINNASENDMQLIDNDNSSIQDPKKSEPSESSINDIIRTSLERRDNNVEIINKDLETDKSLIKTDSGSNQDSNKTDIEAKIVPPDLKKCNNTETKSTPLVKISVKKLETLTYGTENSPQTTTPPKQIFVKKLEDLKDHNVKETTTDPNLVKTSILSDLMALSGISADDGMLQDNLETLNEKNVETTRTLGSPSKVIFQDPNKNSLGQRQLYALSPVNNVEQLYHAKQQNGQFFILDCDTGQILPANVSVRSKSNKDLIFKNQDEDKMLRRLIEKYPKKLSPIAPKVIHHAPGPGPILSVGHTGVIEINDSDDEESNQEKNKSLPGLTVDVEDEVLPIIINKNHANSTPKKDSVNSCIKLKSGFVRYIINDVKRTKPPIPIIIRRTLLKQNSIGILKRKCDFPSKNNNKKAKTQNAETIITTDSALSESFKRFQKIIEVPLDSPPPVEFIASEDNDSSDDEPLAKKVKRKNILDDGDEKLCDIAPLSANEKETSLPETIGDDSHEYVNVDDLLEENSDPKSDSEPQDDECILGF